MILTGNNDNAGVGLHAGWALTFHRESDAPTFLDTVVSVTSDTHDGQIDATLPGGLEGGLYTIVVEGLSESDHQAIGMGATDRPSVMKLHLFWYDTISSAGAYFANMAGLTGMVGKPSAAELADRLVAVLSVISVTRRAGTRRYETVITARERVFHRLSTRVRGGLCAISPRAAVSLATDAVDVPVEFVSGTFDPDGQLPPMDDVDSELATAMTTFDENNTYRQEVTEVATAIERSTRRYGRGVLLIRDGTLHVGVRAPGAFGGMGPVPLSPRTGLVEVTAGAVAEQDTSPLPATPGRRRYTLILKGRPDLKPGAIVQFDLPSTEQAPATPSIGSALIGALGIAGPVLPSLPGGDGFDHPQLLYVDAVSHKLGRTSSFVTTVSGVAIERATTVTDLYDPPPPSGTNRGAAGGGAADSTTRAVHAVRDGVRSALNLMKLAEAGEVRVVTSSGDASAEHPPRQTATVWRGLATPDGHPNRLARLPVRRTNPDIRERVPHVTPFAWGSTGLVVPRYPGTRVLLAHGKGDADDPVDLGALWETDMGPEEAQPGDWWLILPVGVDTNKRSSLPDSEEPPDQHNGSVTQDLIDADGNRIIEVGELTIRVTRDHLASAGTRPQRPPQAQQNSVTIEHVDGESKIVMKADGTVQIKAKRIELDAGSDGDIALTAKSVTVSVQQSMNVS